MHALGKLFGRKSGGNSQPAGPPMQIIEGVSCSASSEKNEDSHADQVLTSNRDETWHSGGNAPAFIDVDLGAAYKVSHLRLLPYQVPTSGLTVHRMFAGMDPENLQPVGELRGETQHHQWVDNVPLAASGGGGNGAKAAAEPPLARYVRVETVESPAWVAWSGIQVFGHKA